MPSGRNAPASTPGTSRLVRARGPSADAMRERVYSPRYVTTSTFSPTRRSTCRAPGVRAHQISWPCVVATIRRIPPRRSAGAIAASGAAAPNHTRSQPCSRAMRSARAVTRPVGSSVRARSRITGNGSVASYASAPGSDDV
ncbi:hypothetical protein GCM10023237_11670 [Streptomyces coeruleoprunus]